MPTPTSTPMFANTHSFHNCDICCYFTLFTRDNYRDAHNITYVNTFTYVQGHVYTHYNTYAFLS